MRLGPQGGLPTLSRILGVMAFIEEVSPSVIAFEK
jgi:hypothetical protein